MHISLDENHPKAPRAGALARELFTACRSPVDREVLNDTMTAVFHEVAADQELLSLFIYSQAILAHYAFGLAEGLAAKPREEMQAQYVDDPQAVREQLFETLMRVHVRDTDPDAADSGPPNF